MRRMVLDDGESRTDLAVVDTLGKTKDGRRVLGEYHKGSASRLPRMEIVGGLSPFKTTWIIWHELLHRWEDAFEGEIDHAALDEIARFITRVCRNSPALTKYLYDLSRRR